MSFERMPLWRVGSIVRDWKLVRVQLYLPKPRAVMGLEREQSWSFWRGVKGGYGGYSGQGYWIQIYTQSLQLSTYATLPSTTFLHGYTPTDTLCPTALQYSGIICFADITLRCSILTPLPYIPLHSKQHVFCRYPRVTSSVGINWLQSLFESKRSRQDRQIIKVPQSRVSAMGVPWEFERIFGIFNGWVSQQRQYLWPLQQNRLLIYPTASPVIASYTSIPYSTLGIVIFCASLGAGCLFISVLYSTTDQYVSGSFSIKCTSLSAITLQNVGIRLTCSFSTSIVILRVENSFVLMVCYLRNFSKPSQLTKVREGLQMVSMRQVVPLRRVIWRPWPCSGSWQGVNLIIQVLYFNKSMFCVILLTTTLVTLTSCTPKFYQSSQVIPLKVHDLDSRSTRLRFDYSTLKLCPVTPSLTTFQNQLNFQINALRVIECEWLCKVELTSEDVRQYKWMIDNNYEVFYSVSNEISALYENKNGKETSYDLGFPVGWRDQHKHQGQEYQYVINNQINLQFLYRRDPTNISKGIQIVNLIVKQDKCSPPFPLNNDSTFLAFYYSVNWRRVDNPIADPPDVSDKQRVTWLVFGFVTSLVYCGVVMGVVWRGWWSRGSTGGSIGGSIGGSTGSGSVVIREDDRVEQQVGLPGWRELKGEVFRPPKHPLLYSILIGSGIQTIILILLLLTTLSLKGYQYLQLQDTHLSTLFMNLLTFSSFFSGLVSSRIYLMWHPSTTPSWPAWLLPSILSSLISPVTLEILMLIENFIRQAAHAKYEKELLMMCLKWEVWAVVLGGVGGVVGARVMRRLESPELDEGRVATVQEYEFGRGRQFAIGFLTSLIPYLCFAAEYHIFLDSFWLSTPYTHYLSQTLSLIFLLFSSSLASTYSTYKSLSRGNPKFWAIPWMVAAGVAFCLISAQIFYVVLETDIRRLSGLGIFVLRSIGAAWMVFLMVGAAGWLGCVIVVRRMYGVGAGGKSQ